MSTVVWVSTPATSTRLCGHLSSPRLRTAYAPVVVDSAEKLVDATKDSNVVAFLDNITLLEAAKIKPSALPRHIIVVCDEPLHGAVNLLVPHDWVSHVISNTMLGHPIVEEHLENVLNTLTSKRTPRLLDWLGPDVAGRRIRLTHASGRAARLERMTEFFTANGVGSRTLEHLRDAAEELLTNAFYDAPVTAGALKKPVPRTQDIALPDDAACDLAYGCREDLGIVRVRDPFGSLSRRRLVEVLARCARTDMTVSVDETMGGAGLGMWRIFSGASFVAISVVKNRHTEILVGVAKKAIGGKRPYAFHFFFRDTGTPTFWGIAKDDSTKASANRSVMLVTAKPE